MEKLDGKIFTYQPESTIDEFTRKILIELVSTAGTPEDIAKIEIQPELKTFIFTNSTMDYDCDYTASIYYDNNSLEGWKPFSSHIKGEESDFTALSCVDNNSLCYKAFRMNFVDYNEKEIDSNEGLELNSFTLAQNQISLIKQLFQINKDRVTETDISEVPDSVLKAVAKALVGEVFSKKVPGDKKKMVDVNGDYNIKNVLIYKVPVYCAELSYDDDIFECIYDYDGFRDFDGFLGMYKDSTIVHGSMNYDLIFSNIPRREMEIKKIEPKATSEEPKKRGFFGTLIYVLKNIKIGEEAIRESKEKQLLEKYPIIKAQYDTFVEEEEKIFETRVEVLNKVLIEKGYSELSSSEIDEMKKVLKEDLKDIFNEKTHREYKNFDFLKNDKIIKFDDDEK